MSHKGPEGSKEHEEDEEKKRIVTRLEETKS